MISINNNKSVISTGIEARSIKPRRAVFFGPVFKRSLPIVQFNRTVDLLFRSFNLIERLISFFDRSIQSNS